MSLLSPPDESQSHTLRPARHAGRVQHCAQPRRRPGGIAGPPPRARVRNLSLQVVAGRVGHRIARSRPICPCQTTSGTCAPSASQGAATTSRWRGAWPPSPQAPCRSPRCIDEFDWRQGVAWLGFTLQGREFRGPPKSRSAGSIPPSSAASWPCSTSRTHPCALPASISAGRTASSVAQPMNSSPLCATAPASTLSGWGELLLPASHRQRVRPQPQAPPFPRAHPPPYAPSALGLLLTAYCFLLATPRRPTVALSTEGKTWDKCASICTLRRFKVYQPVET